jgi:hypothetical protein
MKPACVVALLFWVALNTFQLEAQQQVAPGVFQLGQFQNTNITESSGVIVSRRGRNAYWTHNDGDDRIFAFTPNGRPLGSWSLKLQTIDFEDIAWSPGRIYIADIGNNLLDRTEISVFAVPEPGPTFSGSLPLKGRWRLNYSAEPFDAESLLIHRHHGYIIAKQLVDGHARVYHFPLKPRGGRFVLEPQCELDTDDDVGGADLTRDGNRLAVITSGGAYLFDVPGGIPSSGQLEPTLFVPFALDRMEACAFTRNGLIVTAETGEILLFDDPLFRAR